MALGKIKLYLKNVVKRTKLGRVLRDKYQRSGLSSRKEALKVIREYEPDITTDKANMIVDDMLVEAKEHDFAFYEYMMYKFYDMPKSERREYVSALERITFCERMNNLKNVIIFDDKGKTYTKYHKWYNRDLMQIPQGG